MPSSPKPIQSNIKKKLRKMLFKESNHPIELSFQKLNILNFNKLKLLKIGTFMWKVLNDEVPQILKDHFSIRKRNYGHNNAKFHLPLANTNLSKREVVYLNVPLYCSRLVRTLLKLWFTDLIFLKFWFFLPCYKGKLDQ